MRKLMLYGIIIFQVALIISLVRGAQLSVASVSRIADMKETKAKLESEQERLKKEREYVQSPYYLEKVARDELNMSKPGETVVIVPDSRIQMQDSRKDQEEKEERQNWQKWWEVFFGH